MSQGQFSLAETERYRGKCIYGEVTKTVYGLVSRLVGSDRHVVRLSLDGIVNRCRLSFPRFPLPSTFCGIVLAANASLSRDFFSRSVFSSRRFYWVLGIPRQCCTCDIIFPCVCSDHPPDAFDGGSGAEVGVRWRGHTGVCCHAMDSSFLEMACSFIAVGTDTEWIVSTRSWGSSFRLFLQEARIHHSVCVVKHSKLWADETSSAFCPRTPCC